MKEFFSCAEAYARPNSSGISDTRLVRLVEICHDQWQSCLEDCNYDEQAEVEAAEAETEHDNDYWYGR